MTPRLSLPVSGWPSQDQVVWQSAGDELDDFLISRSQLASIAPTTRLAARHSLGRFMSWMADHGWDGTAPSITDHVDEARLCAFIRHEQARVQFSTLSTVLYHLIVGLQAFGPDRDWKWAWRIFRRVHRRALAAPVKQRPVVHASRLYRAGLSAMQTAASSNPQDPALYRNGLCVAFLTACPMRIRNLSSLQVDQHLRNREGRWEVVLRAGETKTRQADCWAMPSNFVPWLERYLHDVRPALLSRSVRADAGHLWIGNSGRPVGIQVVRHWIENVTELYAGVRMNPHQFRHCAATTLTLERPLHTVEAACLLGHASGRTTERHYIMQNQQLAQASYLEALERRTRAARKSGGVDQ